jgi:hypothetical protein
MIAVAITTWWWLDRKHPRSNRAHRRYSPLTRPE